MNVVLSPIEIPALVDLIAAEVETRIFNRIPPSPQPDLSDKIFTVEQAAAFLSTSPGEIYQLVHRRAIPFSKKGRLYFSEKEIRSWIQSSRHQTIEEIRAESLGSLLLKTDKQ